MALPSKIETRTDGRISQIILSNPPANIIDFEMMGELAKALEDLEGAGAKFLKLSSSLPNFSAGVDIKIHTPDQLERMLGEFHSLFLRLHRFEGITIAVLDGFALGGGLELALACDFIFAAPDARLGFPEISLACFPPIAAVLLPQTIGRSAHRVLYTGEVISAPEAKSIGLIDGILDAQTLEDLLNRFHGYSFNALKTLKRVFRLSANFDFESTLKRAEQIYLSELKSHPDTVEAIRAFLEKRTPKFKE